MRSAQQLVALTPQVSVVRLRGERETSMKKLTLLVAALGAVAIVGPASAQEWPTKEPIKVVVPFTPGSATDIVARVVFNQVSQQIGQAVVV